MTLITFGNLYITSVSTQIQTVIHISAIKRSRPFKCISLAASPEHCHFHCDVFVFFYRKVKYIVQPKHLDCGSIDYFLLSPLVLAAIMIIAICKNVLNIKYIPICR